MSFPKYIRYQESGVEWLGDVPSHWTLERLRYLARITGGGTPSRENAAYWNGDIPWISPKDMKSERVIEAEECITDAGLNNCSSALQPTGRILMVIRSGILKHTLPVGINDAPVALNQDLKAFSFDERSLPPFFLRWVQGLNDSLLLVWANEGATVESINQKLLQATIVPLPPVEEQKAIISFLDRETAKIDALVAEQRRLIELLKEKRQAVISHAVTKGLNPDVPMKPSGIEWLGDVPSHWNVSRCRHFIRVLSGFAFPSAQFSTEEADWRLLRGANVGVGRTRWDDVAYWKRSPGDGFDEFELSAGDLIIGMDRPLIADGIRLAKVDKSDLPCLLLQRVASLKLGPLIDGDYLAALLSSNMFIAHFLPETTGVSVPHISPDQILDFVIPVPPLEEQQRISAFIRAEANRLDELAFQVEKAVDILQERRTALISAAVTGKIDVRHLAESEAA